MLKNTIHILMNFKHKIRLKIWYEKIECDKKVVFIKMEIFKTSFLIKKMIQFCCSFQSFYDVSQLFRLIFDVNIFLSCLYLCPLSGPPHFLQMKLHRANFVMVFYWPKLSLHKYKNVFHVN